MKKLNSLAVILALLFSASMIISIYWICVLINNQPGCFKESSDINTPLFPFRFYLIVLFSHAFSCFMGGFIPSVIAENEKLRLSLWVGSLLTIGILLLILEMPFPLWFSNCVLAFCLPLSMLGGSVTYWMERKIFKDFIK